jgi:hypothetical protein
MEPTYREVPRPLAIPSGWKPSGSRMRAGNGRAAAAVGVSTTRARATSRRMGRRRTACAPFLVTESCPNREL